MKSISASLSDTLKESDLKGLTTEWSEVFLDTFFADGVLKEIPIISSIIGIGKTGSKINETIFLKKILYFISQVNEIPAEEREKVISQIDDSKKYRIKIGEKLLYIIDKCDDHEKAEIIGHLFGRFLRKKIDYDSFLRCTLVIEKCIIDELKWFVRIDKSSYEIRFDSELFSWGLLELAPLEVKIVSKNSGALGGNGFEIDNKDLKLKVSSTGKIIRDHLSQYMYLQHKALRLCEKDANEISKYIQIVNNDFRDSKDHSRLSHTYIDVIIDLCCNWTISEEEFQSIVSEMIIYVGHNFIKTVDGYIVGFNKICIENGNEFNILRWQNFNNEFRKVHEQRIR